MKTSFLSKIAFLAVVIALYSFSQCEKDTNTDSEQPEANGSDPLAVPGLEKPAKLTDVSEQMIYKENFTVSYNLNTFCPNYVAWHLTAERTQGEAKRYDSFLPDPDLPKDYQVVTKDYSNSGYDRGHMCPAADNKDSEEHMRTSFMMTNMCPQTHNLNAGDWAELEDQCREWAQSYGSVYIVAGPIFDSKKPKKIGQEGRMKISVPDRFFKCVLMLGREPKTIAFIYPNAATNKDIRDYAISVDEAEKITNIDFFPLLPDDIETRIEAICSPAAWGI